MQQAAVEVPQVEKKKGKGRMVGMLVALVLVLSAGAAGAVFAPRLLAKAPPAEKAAEGGEEAEGEAAEEATDDAHAAPAEEEAHETEQPAKSGKQRAGIVGEVTELQAIIVDARSADGSIRHIKVVLAIEHPKEFKADEFKHYVPFAREAAISFLRTREFEQLSDPKNFDSLRKQVAAEIIDAVGKKHAKRVLITDYVVQ